MIGAEVFPAQLRRLVSCCSWFQLDAVSVSSLIATNSRSGWCSVAKKSMRPEWPKPLIAILADIFVSPADSREDRKPNEFPNTLSWKCWVLAQRALRSLIVADSAFGSSPGKTLFPSAWAPDAHPAELVSRQFRRRIEWGQRLAGFVLFRSAAGWRLRCAGP